MRIFVLTANYKLRVSRKSHLRDHPTYGWLAEDVGRLLADELKLVAGGAGHPRVGEAGPGRGLSHVVVLLLLLLQLGVEALAVELLGQQVGALLPVGQVQARDPCHKIINRLGTSNYVYLQIIKINFPNTSNVNLYS
jgi:hypothetical protein